MPARVFVLGDSVAMSLSYALAATAPRGTTVKDDGQFGCGLAVSTAAAGLDRVAACNSATPVDKQWPAVYQRALATSQPGDDVVFAAGPWETAPLLIDGKWVDIASRSIQKYELDQIRLLVGVAKAHGAHLDLLTMACLPPGSRPALGLPPDDSPAAPPYLQPVAGNGGLGTPSSGQSDPLWLDSLSRGIFPSGPRRSSGSEPGRYPHAGLCAGKHLCWELQRRGSPTLLCLVVSATMAPHLAPPGSRDLNAALSSLVQGGSDGGS